MQQKGSKLDKPAAPSPPPLSTKIVIAPDSVRTTFPIPGCHFGLIFVRNVLQSEAVLWFCQTLSALLGEKPMIA